MTIHIGELIEERLNERGMTKAEFGRRINTSRQNVGLILERKSMDTAQLTTICKVLDYDFFDHIDRPRKDTAEGKPPKRTYFVVVMEEEKTEE